MAPRARARSAGGVAVSTALDLTFGPALAVGTTVGAPLDSVVSLGFYVKIPGFFYVGGNILDVE